MVEIPDLVQNSARGAKTAKIWNSTSLGVKGIRDLREGICCCIGRNNSGTRLSPKVVSSHGLRQINLNLRSEYIVSRIHLEDLCDCLIEVHDFLVFLVSRFVTGNVKRRCASSVL